MRPVAGLVDQRREFAPPSAEDDRRDGHASRGVGLRRIARILGGGHGKARVRMRRRAVLRVVGTALPVGHRGAALEALPPGLAVGGDRHVGKDRVAADHLVGVAVGVLIGAGHHAKVAGLRVDGPQPAVRPGVQPGDVVADRPDLPARHRRRRDQHGEVGLAAGRRERGGDVMRLALGVLDADDQHVLGHPALGAGLPAGDAQRMALLAEQRVAAIARAVAHDGQVFREMHDVAAVRVEFADRVPAADEAAVAGDALERGAAHAGHDAHVGGHVGAVGHLDAAARVG